MNREIKFRAILKKEHSFRDVYAVNFLTKTVAVLISGQYELHEYKELVQYIGVKDINGKEIYEGDIIKSANGNGIVIFKYGSFYYDLIKPIDPMLMINGAIYWDKVIGNIFENPDLLK